LPCAAYADKGDAVWLSEFEPKSLVRFDLAKAAFESSGIPTPRANVRQMLRDGDGGAVSIGEMTGTHRIVTVQA
jgi:streptogramin lyase